tara:strand:+ start:32976 stop:33335 length:360 start_codon:yes stop_codon:yes gene_type:complete
MKKEIKIKINGFVAGSYLLIALKKTTIEKQSRFKYDDFGNKTNEMYEVEQIIKEEVDTNHIYFKDTIPVNGIIKLPNFLLNKEILIRIRNGGEYPMTSVDYNIKLDYNQSILMFNKLDI